MNWKQWVDWKEKKYIVVVGFALAYLLTIPIRDYSFLEGIFDISQGVPVMAHLIIIVVVSVVLLILLKIIEIVVGSFLKG